MLSASSPSIRRDDRWRRAPWRQRAEEPLRHLGNLIDRIGEGLDVNSGPDETAATFLAYCNAAA